jgi:hypothetical protein
MPGKIVLARAQVRTTVRWLDWFNTSIFFASLGSMYGPFFEDRDTLFSSSTSCNHWRFPGQRGEARPIARG